jgi:hypothetical protein
MWTNYACIKLNISHLGPLVLCYIKQINVCYFALTAVPPDFRYAKLQSCVTRNVAYIIKVMLEIDCLKGREGGTYEWESLRNRLVSAGLCIILLKFTFLYPC